MALMASSCEANSTSASPEALPVWSCSRRTLIGTIGLKNCNKTSDGDCERRALAHISNIRCRGLEREPPHVDAVQVPRVPVARLVGLPPRVDLVRAAPPSSRLAPVVVVPDPVGRRSVVVVVVGGVVREVCPLEVARTSRLEPVRVAEPVASVVRARPGVVHSGVGTAAPVRVAQHAVHFGQAATKDFDVSGEKTPK
jgi:hypothetical protein